jgi:hypothetical protein
MQIGDTLYTRDGNRRLYQNDDGTPSRSTNERYKWQARKIIRETRDSWILEHDLLKVNKKTLELRTNGRPGLDRYAYTEQGMEDRIWREMNAHAVYRAVQDADTATLRKVAALVGID